MQSPIVIPPRFRDLPPPPAGRGYEWPLFMPFIVLHLLPFLAIWTGTNPIDWVVCAALYFGRMFFVTGAYHRYFSHRTYKTSRAFQFLLALGAMSSSQKGALWWAAHHRNHHKFSDLPWDVHSPIQRGFWYSHVGWLMDRGTEVTHTKRVTDLARYPELVWLNKNWLVPPVALGTLVWALLGWSGLFIGFALSTVLLWHGTFTINSLSHVFGRRRFPTEDTSRNNWLLALITLGEGWHNNHHHHMSSTRQGFYWWEIDITFYILKALSWVGLVWDLRPVPEDVLAEGRARDAADPQGTAPLPLAAVVTAPVMPAAAAPGLPFAQVADQA
jgi:stearoyl-CoA desaturase (delta-9 desaturase)